MTIVFLFLAIGLLSGCQSTATATPAPTVTPSPTRELPVTVMMQATATATATIVQNNPTPYPSPTPLPTATPITYVIQEGDTLLGIAIDHQTTTEEIEALNPEVDARMLSSNV